MRSILGRLLPIALTVGALGLPVTASAATTTKQVKAAKQAGAAYLQTLQKPSGGFETDWVLGALAGAGDAAANVKGPGVASDARSYYFGLVNGRQAALA